MSVDITFVAEIGLNYNGQLSLAYEMIRQAKSAGADIAKFQLGWRGDPGEINYLPEDALRSLRKWCDFYDIEMMVSIFNKEALDLARKIGFDRFKVASRTVVDDLRLAEEIVRSGKSAIVSLGMWESEELPLGSDESIKYLFCRSIYPTSPWDLEGLPKDFGSSRFDGYSDHSLGIEVPLLAIARGATIIEKHFTLDKSDTTIRDHVLSATPEEFANLTSLGRSMRAYLDSGV